MNGRGEMAAMTIYESYVGAGSAEEVGDIRGPTPALPAEGGYAMVEKCILLCLPEPPQELADPIPISRTATASLSPAQAP